MTRHALAFDYASARRVDESGRLHVEGCRISAARVNEYLGSEIPGADALGLDPNRLYPLYRDAAALKASAPSFENMPLMSQHIIVSAAEPAKWAVAGSLSNVRWAAPYLVADIAVWDQSAISRIRDGSQKEISCGYVYRPVMEPGSIGGVRFAGRMFDIRANHVALVPMGRVGSDCVVADAALDQEIEFEHDIGSLVRGYNRLR
jgi:uncharacterized protein